MLKLNLAAWLIVLLAALFTLSLGFGAFPSPQSGTAAVSDSSRPDASTLPVGESDDATGAALNDSAAEDASAGQNDGGPAAGDSPAGGDSAHGDEGYAGAERLRYYHPQLTDGAAVGPQGAEPPSPDAAEDIPAGGGGDGDMAGENATDGYAADAAVDPIAALAANAVVLSPVADAYVRAGGDAGRNFGATKSLKAMKASPGSDNPPTQTYLRFEVGAVGAIAKATLRLYCDNDSRDSFDVVTSSSVNWDEKTLTWNNKPAADGAKVGSAGSTKQGDWVEVDVTAGVRASGAVSFALLPRSTDAFGALSRESSDRQPELVLETAAKPPVVNGAGTSPIFAEADAYVRASKPTSNFGAQPKVTVDTDGGDGDALYGFLRFRVGDAGNIARATLRLFVVGSSDDSAEIHFVSSSNWNESTITWNSKPTIDGPVASVIGNTKSGKWVDVDVSSLVTPNSVLTLAVVPSSNDSFDFSSREGDNAPRLVLETVADDEVNLDCTLVVPDNPLSPAGLATPYELVATDPEAGACHQYAVDQRGFAEAAIIDPATGQVSIYHPLVIDKGTVPAIPLVAPVLPRNAVVGIWYGSNADFLRQQGATDDSLDSGKCVGGLKGDSMGQFSHCNAEAFFKAANKAISDGKLIVPPLGTANDGLPCPTVRDYFTVDQDQSDNVLSTYLLTSDGRLAQNTDANRARLGTGAKVIVNPSDNRVTSVLLDSALACTPWNAPSLDNPGEMVPSLVLNELLAAKWQQAPVATVPLLDPFALLEDGTPSLTKLNLHRVGVGQPPVKSLSDANSQQRDYCRNMRSVQPARLFRNQTRLSARPSPFPDIGNSAFTFLVTRFNVSWDNLGCTDIVGQRSPISLVQDAKGITIGATLRQ